MPVILVTQEAKIRRIEVRSQPEQIVQEIIPQKKMLHNKKGLTQGIGLQFKPRYHRQKNFRVIILLNRHVNCWCFPPGLM
jgi:hypothetical protein